MNMLSHFVNIKKNIFFTNPLISLIFYVPRIAADFAQRLQWFFGLKSAQTPTVAAKQKSPIARKFKCVRAYANNCFLWGFSETIFVHISSAQCYVFCESIHLRAAIIFR